MSSVGRGFAQRLTKHLVTLHGNGSETALFLKSDFDTWVAANRSFITVASSIYIINGASLDTVLGTDAAAASSLNPTGRAIEDIMTGGGNGYPVAVLDMGKEIRIGTSARSDCLVFRLVQVPGKSVNDGNGGRVGYVVVENNVIDIRRDLFEVNVARV